MKLRSMLFAAVAMLGFASLAGAAVTQFDFDLPRWHYYTNDFDRYIETDWTLTTTEAGSGSATEAPGLVDQEQLGKVFAGIIEGKLPPQQAFQ